MRLSSLETIRASPATSRRMALHPAMAIHRMGKTRRRRGNPKRTTAIRRPTIPPLLVRPIQRIPAIRLKLPTVARAPVSTGDLFQRKLNSRYPRRDLTGKRVGTKTIAHDLASFVRRIFLEIRSGLLMLMPPLCPSARKEILR